MVRFAACELLERQIDRVFKGFVILADFHRIDHFDQRSKVLFFFRGFIMDIPNQSRIEKRFGFLPEVVAGFAVPLGVGDQGVDEFQNIFFGVDILERVVVMGLFEIDRVEYSDLVVIALEELPALDYDAAFWVCDNVARMELHEVRLNEEAGFAGTGAAHNKDVLVPRVSRVFRPV